MINLKTKEEIEIMQKGGKILAEVIFEVMRNAKPGVSELELDKLAEELILKKGGKPGFKKVPGYKRTICVSTNEVVVHGIPTSYTLKEGDVFGVDCGVYLEGFHTDMAETIRVGSSVILASPEGMRPESGIDSGVVVTTPPQNDEIDTFLETGKRALELAIEKARVGNRIGDISKTIQDIVEAGGYSVVRSLIGHGVGRSLHEEPEVPGYLNRKIEKTSLLVEGMTIAIEVIYNMGKKEVKYKNADGWTISTQDASLSGLFERTIAVTKEGPLVITQ